MPPPVVGPAVGFVPLMPPLEPAVTETAYAVGPAREAATAAVRATASSRTRRPDRKRKSPAIASTITTATVGHSQEFQSVARRSRTTAQMPVAANAAGRTHSHFLSVRKACRSISPPPPHSAAMPGARAVV